jgi:hypothetical protein
VEGTLNLNPRELSLPVCKECPEYKHCCDGLDSDSDGSYNIFCMAIDENAAGKSILAALSRLGAEERNEILRCQVE